MKLLARTKPATKFEEVLTEMVAALRELRRIEDRSYARLSREAFVAQALAAARWTAEEAEVLDRALLADEAAMPHAATFVRDVAAAIGDGHVGKLPQSAGKWAHFDTERLAPVEAAPVGGGDYLRLAAAAAVRAARNPRAAFGQIASWDEWERQRAQLRETLDSLARRAHEVCGEDDLDHESYADLPAHLREAGYPPRAWYRVSARAVPRGPEGPRQLAEFLLGDPAAKLKWQADERERELAPLAEQLQGKSDLDAVTIPAGFTIPGYLAWSNISAHAARELVTAGRAVAEELRGKAETVGAAARRLGAEA